MKKINRKKIKALMIAKKIIEITQCSHQLATSDNIAKTICLVNKGAVLKAVLSRIMQTPSIVFRFDGKIDKRRLRRYVTKHKHGGRIYPSAATPFYIEEITQSLTKLKNLNTK